MTMFGHGKLSFFIQPNKKISVLLATGLKNLGREGKHIFFNYFFSEKI